MKPARALKSWDSDGGRLASFTCPRCGYLPDRFFSRRISAQIRLNRLIVLCFALAQLGGLWLIQQHLNRADRLRAELLQHVEHAEACRGVP